MKKYMVKQILILGYVDVPEGKDPSTYLDETDSWPDDGLVDDVMFVEVPENYVPLLSLSLRARLLVSDPGGRFSAGEEGILLAHASEKYQYFVRLPGMIRSGAPFNIDVYRDFFFYEGEVEILK